MKERQPPIDHIMISPLRGRRVRVNRQVHGNPHPSLFSPLPVDKATTFKISEAKPEHSNLKNSKTSAARATKISVAAKGQSDFQHSPLRRGNVSPRRGIGRCQSEAVGGRRSPPMMIPPPPLSPPSSKAPLASRKMNKERSDFQQHSLLRRRTVSPRRGIGRYQSEAVGGHRSPPVMIPSAPLSPSSSNAPHASRKIRRKRSDFQHSPSRRGNVSPGRGIGRCQSEAVGGRRSPPVIIPPAPVSPTSSKTSLFSRTMSLPQSPNRSRETVRHTAFTARNIVAPRSPTRSASKMSLHSTTRRGVPRCQSESIAQQHGRQQKQCIDAMPVPPLSPRSAKYRVSLNEPPSPPKDPSRSVTRSASARFAASPRKKFSSLSDIIAEYDMIQEEEPSQLEI